MTDQHRTTARDPVSGYDAEPDHDDDRPSAPSPALGRDRRGRPSMALDFLGLTVALLALLAFIAIGGAWLGSVVGP